MALRWSAEPGVEATPPGRQKAVPASGHGQARHHSNRDRECRNQRNAKCDHGEGGDCPANAGVTEASQHDLRHGGGEVDLRDGDIAEHGAGGDDVHQRNARHGDEDGAGDVVFGLATFLRKDGALVEAAQREERHFGEDVQRDEREAGPCEREGNAGKRVGFCPKPDEQIGHDEKDDDRQDGAGAAEPLGDVKAADVDQEDEQAKKNGER